VKFALLSQKTNLSLFTVITCLLTSSPSFACPDLNRFYELMEGDPSSVEAGLAPFLAECAESSEYFALLGASQLSTGNLFQALENLELSLLLDPNNGAALVDYAEVLFRQGQVLSALELNEELLDRNDLPGGLKDGLALRQRRWSRATIISNGMVSGSVGHDNNLNSAPLGDQLALTLSGKSVILDVSPEYKSQGGGYTKLSAGMNFTRLGQSFNSQFSGQLRGRFGKDSQYELLQGSMQGRLSPAGDSPGWDAMAGLDHIVFGGNTIFSSSTVTARYFLGGTRSCNFYPRLALQYQYFHSQRSLSGVESSLGVGADCRLALGSAPSRLSVEASAISNNGTERDRLGEDRGGWQMNFIWQSQIGQGQILAQYVLTELDDEAGYSPLFAGGAKREESLDSAFLQYTQPIRNFSQNAQFFANVSYHSQTSTIDLFKTRGITAEIGVNWGF